MTKYTLYTKDDIEKLKEEIEKEEEDSKICEIQNYNKDRYSNSFAREVQRLKKLVKLIRTGVKVEKIHRGLALINDKFVVSLLNNKWKILHKNKWYLHKQDLQHFIDNYILKENKYETND